MKFAFIAEEKADEGVARWCRALSVSRAGYYAWSKRPESRHAREDRRLAIVVRDVHESSRRTYGSPRVLAELVARDEHVGRNRIIRLMQQEGLEARVRRRYRSTTMSEHHQPVAPNLLDRRFEAELPNQRWVGDTTELFVADGGRLFLAAILDLHSRFVVGWALSAVNDRHLAVRALEAAVRTAMPRRRPASSLRPGSPYASDDYQRVLGAHGITCSMSRRGNCYDNAAMESWFSTLKFELGERYATRAEAKEKLFDYIEVFYNQQRRHSSLDYVSPAGYEKAARESRATA